MRIKNNSIFLATSYRRNGKNLQDQKYLGKSEILKVKRERLQRIFDWSWSLKVKLDDNDDNPQRSLLQEISYDEAKISAGKLVHQLAVLLKDKNDEYLEVDTKSLWQAVYLTEKVIVRVKDENAQAISTELQKILLRPWPTSIIT